MDAVTATFSIPDWIAKGLASGAYERIGGVIREVGTKQVVTWLRESRSITPLPTDPVTGVLNLIVSGANLRVSIKGFADVSQRLGGIEQHLQQIQGVLQVSSAASMLNLGVSVMGFAVVMQRLKELEGRLQQAQEALKKIDRKIDLGFYANFRAALDLAMNAFTMSNPSNRERMAIQAINRFLEAEHIYIDYTDQELEQGSQIADEYLLTLSLAYVAEARCYLELEDPDTAFRRLQEGTAILRPRIQKYVDLLLTSNPAAYLQPQFKDQIDLRRLTRIYQWVNPDLDESAVFELQRENLFSLVQNPDKWVDSLPTAVLSRVEVPWGWFGPNPEDLKQEAVKRLPQVLEVAESMIETDRRFEAYQAEVKAITQLEMTFHDWLQLAPATEKPDGAELMYIVSAQPLEV